MNRAGWQRLGRSAGLALFGLVGVLYLSSGLLVPLWGLVVLNAVGAFVLVLTVRESARRWWVAFVGPVAAVLFWFAYVNLGSLLFGWTA